MKTTRTDSLQNLRPKIKTAKTSATSSAQETFQNKTLRPIIKFQHPLLLALVKKHLKKRNQNLQALSPEKLAALLESSFDKDVQLRQLIKGMVLGLFTQEEFLRYSQNDSDIHKRILQICKERVLTNLEEIFS
jgi:hypothetical protein